MPKGRLIIIGVVAVIVIVVVLGFLGIIPLFQKKGPADPNFPSGKVTLTMWGTEPMTSFQDVIKAYQAQYPTVVITYVEQDAPGYEQALVTAMAQGKGPDIFVIGNLSVPQYKGIMAPASSILLTSQMMASLFPGVVTGDFVEGASVYASPLYLDALALYYNKDIFNANSIVADPTTWDDFVADANKIKQITPSKTLTLSGAALGGSQNISRAADVLGALMLQGGGRLNTGQNGTVRFDDRATQALNFYTQFADSVGANYSWNDSFPDSRTAFIQGKTAMVVDYADFRDVIKKQNPFFNFGVAPLPQLAGATASDVATFGRYAGLAVSAQSPNQYVAWHFIKFFTLTPSVSSVYLAASGRLPALDALIGQGLGGNDDVFLRSFLVAKTWQEPNEFGTTSILLDAIAHVVEGKMDAARALNAAQDAINKLW
jgi:multiple sugar transport system substrate-binding protein